MPDTEQDSLMTQAIDPPEGHGGGTEAKKLDSGNQIENVDVTENEEESES